MTHRTLVRALLTSAVLAAGVMLAGCDSDQISLAQNAKANQPVPPKLVAAMTEKDMDMQSPILVRLFKQEAELEVWKQNRSGQFALLKTYPICRWSGDLGPKVREGDRQAPEGFYSINPSQMNPQSAYYLSFNTGYPNAFDKALGRTGSQLMVHGDCSSRGCYAMTDEQIAEIYSLGRESFFGGQKAFQLQAYPFRMTPVNMAKHRNNPNMPFWKMIKEGYDHFEVTKQEPRVDFCEKKYVFDAVKAPGATRDPVFDASARCPAYVIPEEIASAVHEKEQKDAAETAKLVSKGTPVARLNTGIDGGMNAIFASKIPEGNTGLSEGGDSQALASMSLARAPGTIPGTVNPPKPNLAVQQEEPVVATTSSTASSAGTRIASANPSDKSASDKSASDKSTSDKSEGFFSSFARKVGIGGTADASKTTAPPAPAAAAPAKPKVAETKPQSVVRVAPKAEPKQAAKPAPKPAMTTAAAAAPAPSSSTQLAGSAPVVQTNSFDTRFSAVK
ncbi:murein L,D-transpeptidase YafK [Bradyrhizobium sp. USDA 4523]|uniref:L,D-transpeptidase family protein n=1 Tax=unclassified Bradyrhizobium TaxID=2631580 RepID=UPI00209FC3B1|nr:MULTISPECIES: murein L,D-transpeptidase family protein [unclassified Bradyrhizobium]MCP1840917.1 murein L,D-transpeptidase YafK [Bradyrhizobium sp. USDA 4538]MCP1901480.1 murein L,D-transpeptidase YafK [Bradyrhizobium sp. USDA 4537]MCP1992864.1 murein L,D-transpeptidase YafK [Bradyrhizobium sp. USDA 4539]